MSKNSIVNKSSCQGGCYAVIYVYFVYYASFYTCNGKLYCFKLVCHDGLQCYDFTQNPVDLNHVGVDHGRWDLHMDSI